MSCDHCTDPDGQPCFPQYGVAPHIHVNTGIKEELFGGWIHSTRYLPRSEWPTNFIPDPDDDRMGTYFCPKCGDGKPDPEPDPDAYDCPIHGMQDSSDCPRC